jgi:hypothetical protein
MKSGTVFFPDLLEYDLFFRNILTGWPGKQSILKNAEMMYRQYPSADCERPGDIKVVH